MSERKITATHTSAYSEIENIAKAKLELSPPEEIKIPKLKKKCPIDCEGPLFTPHCGYTCAASTGAPS
ncbi:hypothetical protein KR200_005871 [Drosophila serrata]|nr:hypothetical protein KR200_005871 [Drosophila serrata]